MPAKEWDVIFWEIKVATNNKFKKQCSITVISCIHKL